MLKSPETFTTIKYNNHSQEKCKITIVEECVFVYAYASFDKIILLLIFLAGMLQLKGGHVRSNSWWKYWNVKQDKTKRIRKWLISVKNVHKKIVIYLIHTVNGYFIGSLQIILHQGETALHCCKMELDFVLIHFSSQNIVYICCIITNARKCSILSQTSVLDFFYCRQLNIMCT